MRQAVREDYGEIIQYLKRDIPNCIYLYIDTMNMKDDHEEIKLWFDEEENEIKIVVMKYYDSFQIYSHDDNCDLAGVMQLIDTYKVSMISAKEPIIKRLANLCNSYEAEYGSVFRQTKYRNIDSKIKVEEANVADVSEIASLIRSDQAIGGHYTQEVLAKQLADRILNKEGRSFIIRQDGKIVAHTATYAEAEGVAVTGGTIIHEAYRTYDYYYILSNFLMKKLSEEKREVYTFSMSEKMIRLHRIMDEECARYGKLVLKNR